MPIDSLIRQFSESVVQPPAVIQGLAVESATDRQLHQRLGYLEGVIRSGPLGDHFEPEDLPGIDDAIEEARALAQRLGTSGTRSQVEYLERERQQLVEQVTTREEWVEDHADLLHTYTVIKDELAARTTALAVSYQLNPPDDILEALGPRPPKPLGSTGWDAAVTRHAEARIRLGPDCDLTAPSIVEAASWRTAVDAFHPTPELEREPALRLVG